MTQQPFISRRHRLLKKMAPASLAIFLPLRLFCAMQIVNILIGNTVIFSI